MIYEITHRDGSVEHLECGSSYEAVQHALKHWRARGYACTNVKQRGEPYHSIVEIGNTDPWEWLARVSLE